MWSANLSNLLSVQFSMWYMHNLTLNLKEKNATVLLVTNSVPSRVPTLCFHTYRYCAFRPASVLSGPDWLSPDANALCSQRWAQPDDAEEDEPGKPYSCQWDRVCPTAAEARGSCRQQTNLPRYQTCSSPAYLFWYSLFSHSPYRSIN